MKTPEEVKKWLKCWAITNTDECTGNCESCEYDVPMVSSVEIGAVALEYITQLEQRLAQVERERDAAVKDAVQIAIQLDFPACEWCKHKPYNHVKCKECRMRNEGFEWRGVREENSQ